jgi:hypothetical protein
LQAKAKNYLFINVYFSAANKEDPVLIDFVQEAMYASIHRILNITFKLLQTVNICPGRTGMLYLD